MQKAYRAAIVHCLDDPGESGDASAVEYLPDGILVVEGDRVAAVGKAEQLLAALPASTEVTDFSGKLIAPGLIDCHVHFPQVDIIGSYGEKLLDWLERYAYPAEMRFEDPDYGGDVAKVFVDELLRNGTTSALVFPTVHAHSVDAVFEAAASRNMRLISGKVLMDSGGPPALRDDAERGYRESRALIERWHGQGRLGYAITPRYALSCSEAQLEATGRLAREYPDTWIHTHIAENVDEVAEVAARYPWAENYLDVYDHYGLVRARSVFAHCIHLEDGETRRMAEAGAAAAHCPTSNLFLGSGLFDLRRLRKDRVRVGLGTDVGAGISLSLLTTMCEAYKVLHLRDQTLPPTRALYLATLGAAEALYLDDVIGNFEAGKEADFIVLDPTATPLSKQRTRHAGSLDDLLFALIVLGDDRHVAATFVAGEAQAV